MITTTICDGQILMRDREVLVLDEAEVAAEALALAPRVWENYTRNAELALQS